MGTYFNQKDLNVLRALRTILVGIEGRPAGERAPQYWGSPRDIELYDQVFAARIGWKWTAALDEVEKRAGLPTPRTILDWGAGTGIASRVLLRRIEAPERVVLFDRDEAVREFAAGLLRAEFPAVEVVATGDAPEEPFDAVLASHVLDELEDDGVASLVSTMNRAEHVLWVEPGSKLTSRRLSAVRASLLDEFDVVAPCTHRAACGMLAEGRERDWCHLFAKPPAEVHTTGTWSEIHRELRIDLRSLPYSFLALRRAAVDHPSASRLLGRPRFQKGRVLLDLCGQGGVETAQMLQRNDKAFFKSLKDTAGEAVLMEREGDAIRRVL